MENRYNLSVGFFESNGGQGFAFATLKIIGNENWRATLLHLATNEAFGFGEFNWRDAERFAVHFRPGNQDSIETVFKPNCNLLSWSVKGNWIKWSVCAFNVSAVKLPQKRVDNEDCNR